MTIIHILNLVISWNEIYVINNKIKLDELINNGIEFSDKQKRFFGTKKDLLEPKRIYSLTNKFEYIPKF